MFSGIIEIIGIKALADIDPETYTERIDKFYTVLDNILHDNIDTDQFMIDGNRDYFFIKSEKILTLIVFLQKLRSKLIMSYTDPIFCRGVIMSGEYNLLDPDSSSLKSYGFKNFDPFTAQLYGELDNFKGIGIKIDINVIKKLSKKSIEKYTINNYYIEDFNNAIFDEFYDVNLAKDFRFPEMRKVCNGFEKANNLSPKLSRYFIPLFNNIILNWKYKTNETIIEKRQEYIDQKASRKRTNSLLGIHEYDLEQLLCKGYFNRFKKVSGIRIIYLYFLCNLYGKTLINDKSNKSEICELEPSSVNYLLLRLKKNNWFMNFLKENAILSIPSSLLNKSIKRKLLNAIQDL